MSQAHNYTELDREAYDLEWYLQMFIAGSRKASPAMIAHAVAYAERAKARGWSLITNGQDNTFDTALLPFVWMACPDGEFAIRLADVMAFFSNGKDKDLISGYEFAKTLPGKTIHLIDYSTGKAKLTTVETPKLQLVQTELFEKGAVKEKLQLF